MIEVLREEIAFFEEKKHELLRTHPGQFALMKRRELVGIFPTREEAYAEGVRRFGGEPFLIQQITEQQKPEQVPLLAYSLRASL